MTALDIFTYSGQQVRTVIVDGEPWFVAADVARILGYRDSNMLTRRVDDDDKGTQIMRTPGGDQNVTVINEPGLYMGVLGATVPDAREFKRWVTHEVLPAIRKTGQYGSALPSTFAEALEVAAHEARKVEALEAKAALDAPKLEAYEHLMDADGLYEMDVVAKIIGGIGRNTLFRELRDMGILMVGNAPYQRYAHHFKVVPKTRQTPNGVVPYRVTMVRASGLEFIRKQFADTKALTSVTAPPG